MMMMIVLKGIKWLIEQDIKVTVSFVVQKLNYKEMVKAWYLCRDYNIRGITFHMVRKWNHMSDEWWNENRIENNSNIDYTLFKDQLKQLNSAPKILIIFARSFLSNLFTASKTEHALIPISILSGPIDLNENPL